MERAGDNNLNSVAMWAPLVIQQTEIVLPADGMKWEAHNIIYAIFFQQTFNLNLIMKEQRDKSRLCDIL